jgi:hypothetical protein
LAGHSRLTPLQLALLEAFFRRSTSPDFRRLLVSGRDESLVVDLVLDRAPQIHEDKLVIGTIRIDPIDEIFANKLCALP